MDNYYLNISVIDAEIIIYISANHGNSNSTCGLSLSDACRTFAFVTNRRMCCRVVGYIHI